VHEQKKTVKKEITHEQKKSSALAIFDTGGCESAQRARRSRRSRVGINHHAQHQ
jgi:nanoRNase/pAp phosphatase (c-di-AMP/oligoRNAs hydrolase)